MESSQSVRRHLELLLAERARLARQERLYVRLAFAYGCSVFEIARLSGMAVEEVRLRLLRDFDTASPSAGITDG